MPDDDVQATVVDPPPADATTQTPPPAPAYVTVEQFTTMMSEMRESFQHGIQQAVQSVAGSYQMQPAPSNTEEQEPTDEELDAAALEGKGVGAHVRRATRVAMRKLQRETEQQVGQVRDIGLPALAEQSLAIKTPGWEHYTRFQKEIDAGIVQLPLELRSRPSNLQFIYDVVIGKHQKELEKEAVERAIRETRESASDLPPKGGRQPKTDALAPETVFGQETLQVLGHHGKDIATIAKKLGKTPEQYLEGVKRYNERTRGAA